jgi:hypothetical protein
MFGCFSNYVYIWVFFFVLSYQAYDYDKETGCLLIGLPDCETVSDFRTDMGCL